MANTPYRNYPLPNIADTVAEEFYRLQESTLLLIDGDVHALIQALSGKAASSHQHGFEDIPGLGAALEGKMPANKTFAISDLTDVVGAEEAPDGYVLVKVGMDFVAQSAAAAIGDHDHPMSDIIGLEDKLTELTEDLDEVEQVGALNSLPAGAILMRGAGGLFPGFIAWGEGGTYDPSVYPALATWMAANFPSIPTGQLPDYRDYSPRTSGGALGPATGAKQEDAFQGHYMGGLGANISSAAGGTSNSLTTGPDVSPNAPPIANARMTTFISDGVNGTPRIAAETRSKTFGIRWQIKAYGAVVDTGTASLVAIEQGYQTMLNGALRKDIDQNAKALSAPFKINIVNNTLQTWEHIITLRPPVAVAMVEQPDLGMYTDLCIKATFAPTASAPNLFIRIGTGSADAAANYNYQTNYASGSGSATGGFQPNASYMLASFSGAPTSSAYWPESCIYISDFNKPRATRFSALTGSLSSVGAYFSGTIFGINGLAVERDFIQFLPSAGLIGAGSKFVLEGIRG